MALSIIQHCSDPHSLVCLKALGLLQFNHCGSPSVTLVAAPVRPKLCRQSRSQQAELLAIYVRDATGFLSPSEFLLKSCASTVGNAPEKQLGVVFQSQINRVLCMAETFINWSNNAVIRAGSDVVNQRRLHNRPSRSFIHDLLGLLLHSPTLRKLEAKRIYTPVLKLGGGRHLKSVS